MSTYCTGTGLPCTHLGSYRWAGCPCWPCSCLRSGSSPDKCGGYSCALWSPLDICRLEHLGHKEDMKDTAIAYTPAEATWHIFFFFFTHYTIIWTRTSQKVGIFGNHLLLTLSAVVFRHVIAVTNEYSRELSHPSIGNWKLEIIQSISTFAQLPSMAQKKWHDIKSVYLSVYFT